MGSLLHLIDKINSTEISALNVKYKLINLLAGHWGLTAVILATQNAGSRRSAVRSQPR
jgi:hypothetical protein